MTNCLFASDIHGHPDRYEKLFDAVENRAPHALFLGGDLTPFAFPGIDVGRNLPPDFIGDYLIVRFEALRRRMKDRYPRVFVVLGNDDPGALEPDMAAGDNARVWTYCHARRVSFRQHTVYGYSFVPPTPFQLKDWERYDVSRYVSPGCLSPEEGGHSVEVDAHAVRHATIQQDLAELVGDAPLDNAIFLFHTPPHDTTLDRVANDGKSIDGVPLDLHVGSFAVRRMIEARQPLVTLHGHIHESARLTGSWRDTIGHTQMFSAAHDGPELALVSFSLEKPEDAMRELL